MATKEFRGEFAVPIVGMEPAVKRALKLYQDMQKRILVTATPVTIAGEKLHSLLEKVDTEHEVDLAPLPKLVRFAEAGRFQDPEVDEYLKNSLCLLYTSDAADELLCVDLGGRRSIKKKNKVQSVNDNTHTND